MCLRVRSLFLTYLLATLPPLTHARLPHPKANDVIIAGKHLVSRCSASIHNSKAALLSSLLREIDADLPTLLVEANTGTDSVYGFTSLFTSNDAIEPVTATYQKLSDGAPVVLPGGAGEKNVTFVCLEPDDPVTGRFLSWLTAQQPNGAAFNQFGEENIYLTPAFFALMRSPQPYRCPLWRRGRIALNGDDILGTTQYGILIHELVDKYLHFNGLDQPERYNLKDVTGDRWDEEGKVENAENYNFFASSLKAGCTSWPK